LSEGRRLGRFVVTGLAATGADALTYTLGMTSGAAVFVSDVTHGPSADVFAKGASFLVGTVVSFSLARAWTFADRAPAAHTSEAASFLALYVATFVVNVAIHHTLLTQVPGDVRVVAPAAFLTATACSTVLNYLGQRYWVFPLRPTESAPDTDASAR
jgi:putative flippase GtrA